MRALALMFLASGCDRAFGLEHVSEAGSQLADGRRAGLDALVPYSCIAPAGDAVGDIDGDQKQNGVDPCPQVSTTDDTDTDHDTIPDDCDPKIGRADTPRCLFAFSSTTANDALWVKFAALASFGHASGKLTCSTTCGNVASESLAVPGASTTYDASMKVTNGTMAGGVALWARKSATDAPAPTDLGCLVESDGKLGFTLNLMHGSKSTASRPFGVIDQGPLFIRATISSGDPTTVVCEASGNGFYDTDANASLIGAYDAGPGNVAFSSTAWTVDIIGLRITSSD